MPSIRLVEFYSNRISNNNKKENAANEKGLELSNALSQNVSVQDVDVFESNKNIQDIESFYEIIVKYSIPLLNKSRSLKLIINSSK